MIFQYPKIKQIAKQSLLHDTRILPYYFLQPIPFLNLFKQKNKAK
jgi:hypothetical protein